MNLGSSKSIVWLKKNILGNISILMIWLSQQKGLDQCNVFLNKVKWFRLIFCDHTGDGRKSALLSTQDSITSFIWIEVRERGRELRYLSCYQFRSGVINFEAWCLCASRQTICGSVHSHNRADDWNLTLSANRSLTCEASPAIMPCDPRSVLPAATEKGTRGTGRRRERGVTLLALFYPLLGV